jgi:hypothetical protein
MVIIKWVYSRWSWSIVSLPLQPSCDMPHKLQDCSDVLSMHEPIELRELGDETTWLLPSAPWGCQGFDKNSSEMIRSRRQHITAYKDTKSSTRQNQQHY